MHYEVDNDIRQWSIFDRDISGESNPYDKEM